MTEDKYGLVSWNEDVSPRGNSNRSRDEFMRLQSGSNRIRLVTKPFQYWIHKWKEAGDKGFGDKVYCSKFNGSCPLCEKEDRAKKRWFAGIIDRTNGTYKVLDMGLAIYQQIQTYSRDEDWGDPGTYDLDVVVDKNGGATGYYKVVPKPKTPLTDADVEIKQKVDLDSLKKRCKPPTPEEVNQRLARIRSRNGNNVQETAVEETGDQYTFPPAAVSSA